MSKLPLEHRFLDLSDYGRAPARWIAGSLKRTAITPIHITLLFIVSGLVAIYYILTEQYGLAALFLILKSVLDAADGELARVKKTPSYTGRYFDSVSDFLLNLLFLVSIAYVTQGSQLWAITAFLALQLQGTLYNYYYVILRNNFDGDKTSRIFEHEAPVALPGEKQTTVNAWFWMYHICYSKFDKLIYVLDKDATHAKHYPKWFMTAVSTFGLGFQLLIISAMLCLGLADYVIAFFIASSLFIFLFIAVRKHLNRPAGHPRFPI